MGCDVELTADLTDSRVLGQPSSGTVIDTLRLARRQLGPNRVNEGLPAAVGNPRNWTKNTTGEIRKAQ